MLLRMCSVPHYAMHHCWELYRASTTDYRLRRLQTARLYPLMISSCHSQVTNAIICLHISDSILILHQLEVCAPQHICFRCHFTFSVVVSYVLVSSPYFWNHWSSKKLWTIS